MSAAEFGSGICAHCGDSIHRRATARGPVWWSTEIEVGGVFCNENTGGHVPGGTQATVARIRARDLIYGLETELERLAETGVFVYTGYVALSDLRELFGLEGGS